MGLCRWELTVVYNMSTGMPYEEMDGKFYVDHNGSLRAITWKYNDDDDDIISLILNYHLKLG